MKKNCLLKAGIFLVVLTISPHLFAVPSMKFQFSGKASVRGAKPFDNTVCVYLAIVNKAQTTTSWSNDGTSTNGGQPTSCVSLSTGTDGEFSVTLGDTALTNMTALPESTFNTTTSDLYLAVWLKATSFSTEQLTPNILLTSAPYAAGASTIPVGGQQILTVNTTIVGTVGQGEDDLMSYTLPANTLKNTNQVLKITAWGTSAATATAMLFRCYFGSTAIANSQSFGPNATVDFWSVTAYVVRKSSTSQEAFGPFNRGESAGAGALSMLRTTPAETLSNNVTIKCTGQSTNDAENAVDNDIQQTGLIVELLN